MNRFYISTIDPQAQDVALEYGLGLEIAEFCTAWNMDEKYSETDEIVLNKIKKIPNRLLHAPFNELFPCAIDPRARALAAQRYEQALNLAQRYRAEKVIVHGGYHPMIYYPQWYTEQSVLFWKGFLAGSSVGNIVLENVLETEPQWLLDIVREVNDPRLRICLDIGHVNAYSAVPVMQWLETLAPWLSHFHIHNNDGSWDTHSPLEQGSIPMKEFLTAARERCPEATFTLELTDSAQSVRWLLEN